MSLIMSGVIYLKDIPEAYRSIGENIDRIENNHKLRVNERVKGTGFSVKGDEKLDGVEYSLFCTQLRAKIEMDNKDVLLPKDMRHCFGDNKKYIEQEYQNTLNTMEYQANLRQKQGNGPMQWAYNLLSALGIKL